MDKQLLKHGMFSWFELETKDPKKAGVFYRNLFGWKSAVMKAPGMPYTVFSAGKEMIAGMMSLPAKGKKMPPQWGVYVTVDDVDKSAKKAKKLGGKVLVGPQDIPEVGRFAVVRDPQGAVLSIITYGKFSKKK